MHSRASAAGQGAMPTHARPQVKRVLLAQPRAIAPAWIALWMRSSRLPIGRTPRNAMLHSAMIAAALCVGRRSTWRRASSPPAFVPEVAEAQYDEEASASPGPLARTRTLRYPGRPGRASSRAAARAAQPVETAKAATRPRRPERPDEQPRERAAMAERLRHEGRPEGCAGSVARFIAAITQSSAASGGRPRDEPDAFPEPRSLRGRSCGTRGGRAASRSRARGTRAC